MGLLDRIRVEVKKAKEKKRLKEVLIEEEKRRAWRAEDKLKLAEEKLEAKKYIQKAKKAGVDLTEEEAIALVAKRKKEEARKERISKIVSGLAEIGESFSGFGEEKPRSKKGKSKKKSRARKVAEKEFDLGIDIVDFDIFGGSGKRRGGGGIELW
jgi:urease gamma subunit